MRIRKKAPRITAIATVARSWTAGYGLCDEGRPLSRLRSRNLDARETRHKRMVVDAPRVVRTLSYRLL